MYSYRLVASVAEIMRCGFTGTRVADKKYCLLQLAYWTLERITIWQARGCKDQDWEGLKQENPKSM